MDRKEREAFKQDQRESARLEISKTLVAFSDQLTLIKSSLHDPGNVVLTVCYCKFIYI